MLFSVKDTFRAMVEYDSDGKNTVIYDDFGNPNVVVIISKYDMSLLGISELPSGTHPAFIINGEKEVDEIFVGKYDSVLGDGNVCTSIIGDPMELKGHLDTDKYVQQCIRRKGKGWHAMTSIEWGAVALISWKLGTIPHGNMNWGGSSVAAGEYAIPASKQTLRDAFMYNGNTYGIGSTKTGTGPASWSHDGTTAGIYDMVGNTNNIYTPGALNLRGEFLLHGRDNAVCNMVDVDDSPDINDINGYIRTGIYCNLSAKGQPGNIGLRSECAQYGLRNLDDDSREPSDSVARFGDYSTHYSESVYKDLRDCTWYDVKPRWELIAHGIMSPDKNTEARSCIRIGGKRLLRRGNSVAACETQYQESIFETHFDQCNRNLMWDTHANCTVSSSRVVYIPR